MIEVGSYCCSFGRKPLALVEDESPAAAAAFALLRLRDRRDELGAAAGLDDLLRRLAVLIELPVPRGTRIGRVQDRVVEERVGHDQRLLIRQPAGITLSFTSSTIFRLERASQSERLPYTLAPNQPKLFGNVMMFSVNPFA